MFENTRLAPSPRPSWPDDIAGFSPPPSNFERERPFDILKAVALLRRRLGICIACAVAGGALSVTAAIVLGPTFTAAALLAVAEIDDNTSGRPADAAVDTQIALLQSPVFMERAFDALARDGRLRQSVAGVSDLERRLKVIQELRSRLLSISFSAKSPSVAADVVNKVAQLYVEDPVLQSVQSVDDAFGRLSPRIRALEQELQRATNDSEAHRQDRSAAAESAAEASSLRDQIASLKLSQSLARRSEENRQQALAMSPPVQLVALATPPTRRSSMNPALIAIPGTLFSLIFGIASALLLGALDKRVYSLSDLAGNIDVACVGGVPSRRRRSFFGRRKRSDTRRGYRRAVEAVVTETLLLQPRRRRTLLVTASDVRDKAPEFARILAVAAARLDRRVLLVDLDVTQPVRAPSAIRRALGRGESASSEGIFAVLAGRCRPAAAIRSLQENDLHVLPLAQNGDDDSLALIANGRLKHLLRELADQYDWIVVAGPPVVGVNETRIIATVVDSALLVVKSGVSRLSEVREARDVIAASMAFGGLVDVSQGLGAVLIDAPNGDLPARLRDTSLVRSASSTVDPGFAETAAPPAGNRAQVNINRLVAPSGSSS